MRAAWYGKAKDLLSQEEFGARVRRKAEEWGGLLDEDAAARLVLDELGRGEADFQAIRDLREGMEATLRVRVDAVGPIRSFPRQDGTTGRVVNFEISDGTGQCRLVLWDQDVALAERGRIGVGSSLRLLDCFVRPSRYGLEISRGKFGTVLPEQ